MKNTLKKLLIACAIMSSSLAANASLITTDWKDAGDNGAVLDTNTDITWLQLNHSTKSMQTMLNQMVLGGNLEGWSFANREQLDSLWSNGKSYVYSHMNRINRNRYVAARWYNEVTDSSFFMGTLEGNGWYDKPGYLTANSYGWWIVKGEGSQLNENSTQFTLPASYVNASAASVPVPATLGLLSLALAGLSFRRKSA